MMPPGDNAGSRAWTDRAWYAAVLTVYGAAAAALVYLARDRINPDAIAYIQNARHYAAGHLDLAVNGWFGPLISWLLVPAVWIGGEPAVWFRAYNVLFGVVLAGGTMRLTRRLTGGSTAPALSGVEGLTAGGSTVLAAGGRWGRLVFVAALLLSLGVVADELTPDLLLAAALAWYFCAAHGLLFAGGPKKAFVVGVLGGLCYLIKGYALVFVMAHLAMTFFLRWRILRRDQARSGVGRAGAGAMAGGAAALAGVVLAAAPWALVLSAQGGQFRISTIGGATDALRPNPPPVPLPIHLLQPTTPGRITNWENPAEIPLPWGRWESQGTWDRFSRALEAVGLNAVEVGRMVLRFEFPGLLLAGWVVGLGMCLWLGRRLARHAAAGLLWACLSAGLYLGGLLPLWVVPRFLWVLWCPLLAVFAGVLTLLATPPNVPPARPSPAPAPGGTSAVARVLAVLLLAPPAVVASGSLLLGELGPSWKCVRATRLRLLGRAADLRGPVVVNKAGEWSEDNWYQGLFTTYWANRSGGVRAQFLGEFLGHDAGEIAEELRPFGPSTVLVFSDGALVQRLLERGEFQEVMHWGRGKGPAHVRVEVLRFLPSARGDETVAPAPPASSAPRPP